MREQSPGAGRAEVLVDGGFSRRTDVRKELARGVKVVMLGRIEG